MEIDPFETPYSPELASRYFETLERDGFCCVENAISPATLEKFRSEVNKLVAANGRRFLFLVNPYRDKGSAFQSLGMSHNFRKLLLELSNRETRSDHSDSELLNYLRVVPGDKSRGQALNFHFDAEVITALVPIYIPDGPPDKAGHLVALPNFRKIRKFVLLNLIEKSLLQNKLAEKLISFFVLRKGRENHIFKLIPGNVYLFWGYRTLHANLPLDPKESRSTLLFHFGNPHKNSSLVQFIKSRHRQVDIQGNH